MSTQRPKDFSIETAVRSHGFTPRSSDVPALFELLATDDRKLHKAVERALLRIPDVALPAARERLLGATAPLRGRVAHVLTRVVPAGDSGTRALANLLEDPDPKARRAAVIALGKRPGTASENLLLAYLERDRDGLHTKPVVEALGKVGGERAFERLRQIRPTDDELQRILDRANLMLSRTLGRDRPSSVRAEKKQGAPVAATLHCRAGLEKILAEEVPPRFGARASRPGLVALQLDRSLDELFVARTWHRVAFPVPAHGGSLEDAIVEALSGPQARAIFRTFTAGDVRYRLEFARGGRRRSLVWQIAKRVAERAPEVINDPTRSTWDVLVDEGPPGISVELSPAHLADPRFAYRRADVPAASFPQIAAALVRVAGRDPDAVVWDPFVGSGLELCERGLAGPARSLHGSDTSPAALEAARVNLEAAGVRATLTLADATRHEVAGVTLVITNPPFGRRVARGEAGPLVERFLEHAARLLGPGGRFVWISPSPERTERVARAAGLDLYFAQEVDLGGFTGRMEGYFKPTGGGGASDAADALPRAHSRRDAG